MKCLVISDTHGKHEEINFKDYMDYDTIIHCGDFTKTKSSQKKDIEIFLNWFQDLDFKNKILIAGNHDLLFEKQKKTKETILNKYKNDIIYLENEEITIDGIKFFGSPYSNEFFNWAFMEYEINLKKIWGLIPNDVNVLITHGPAYGILDEVLYPTNGDEHVGSLSLTKRKKNLKNLKVHCFGHIHESYGIKEINGVKNINASFLNVEYKPKNKPIGFEI